VVLVACRFVCWVFLWAGGLQRQMGIMDRV